MVVLADSLCDYCKGCISMFVPGYVTGDFLLKDSVIVKV
nr:MAG TPA_asm: hypothetical protein [Bacteriophage sp.]